MVGGGERLDGAGNGGAGHGGMQVPGVNNYIILYLFLYLDY